MRPLPAGHLTFVALVGASIAAVAAHSIRKPITSILPMTIKPLLSRARGLLNRVVYSESLPRAWRSRQLECFWERHAAVVHAKWGRSRDDVEVVGRILAAHRPDSVLDIGCGAGRLFDVYRDQGVGEITGIDISRAALEHARRDHPDVTTIRVALQHADFDRRFDLIVSNRVLQHIPREDIGSVVGKLCGVAKTVYINELSGSDEAPEDFYIFRHDYDTLFEAQGWGLLERGRIGKQTYALFQAQRSSNHLPNCGVFVFADLLGLVYETAAEVLPGFVPLLT